MVALFITVIVSIPRITPEVINVTLGYLELPTLPRGGILDRAILAFVSILLTLSFVRSVERLRDIFDFLFPLPTRPAAPSFRWKSIALSSVGGAIGAWWILVSLATGINEGKVNIDVGVFLQALLIVFAINALAGAPEAVSIEPPFPAANVEIKKNENETSSITGKLLAHSEGHWYLFDDQSQNFVAVPDERADVVCAPRVVR